MLLQPFDGLGIEVYADRSPDTWQYADGQLVMATDPLDAHAVVAAGGDTPWTGMPAGTVMGHIHLHVGDLEVADTFYRRALGLDLTTWSYPGALFFSAALPRTQLNSAAPRTVACRLPDRDLICRAARVGDLPCGGARLRPASVLGAEIPSRQAIRFRLSDANEVNRGVGMALGSIYTGSCKGQ